MDKNITFGYIKDGIAFFSSSILIILFYILKVRAPPIIIPIVLFLIFIFDGIFTLYPSLHNYKLNGLCKS